MYIASVPNRNSPPAILLRESFRDHGKVKTRTLANLTSWAPTRVEALRQVLRGDFDQLPFCEPILNGKHTGRVDVETAKTPTGQEVEVTSLERTLIDITVCPAYSGGVPRVLKAYKRARGRVSISKLFALLDKFKYTYPYHQSIGFYLKRAHYSESDQLLAKASGVQFSFYLCRGLRNPAFDADWKIYFPQSLK